MTDDLPPTAKEVIEYTLGGEMGITFLANEVRVFVPEGASQDDMLAAASFLRLLAERG